MEIKKNIRYLFFIIALIFAVVLLAARMRSHEFDIKAQNWLLSPDGSWYVVVQAINTRSRIDFSTTAGWIMHLPVWVYNNSNTIKVITNQPMATTVIARSTRFPFETRRLFLPSPKAVFQQKLQLTIRAVGPHLVSLGFYWLGEINDIHQYQIWRKDNKGRARLIKYLTPGTITFKDDTVQPNTTYQYSLIARANNKSIITVTLNVTTPPPMFAKSLDTLTGKGMIIYIDPSDPRSAFYYRKLTPSDIIDHSKKLGVRYIQLRTVYDIYSHFQKPNLMKWISNLLDLAAENNIAVFAWSIPRLDTSNAIAEDILVAGLTTPSGNTFAGCALDLETGRSYLGKLPQAREAMANYAKTFRKAVGPDYLVAAIIITPWRTGYTNKNYPYQELAENVDVLQPMVFWHHYYSYAHHRYTKKEVSETVFNSVILIKKLAKRDISVNVIGQSIDLGRTGMPSGEEITTALQAAKDASAIGLSFFAWNPYLILNNNRMSEQAQAIANFQW